MVMALLLTGIGFGAVCVIILQADFNPEPKDKQVISKQHKKFFQHE